MQDIGKIAGIRLTENGTDMLIHVNNQQMAAAIQNKHISEVQLTYSDGRIITPLQRRKAYALLKDISLYTGYLPEECKEVMKYYHVQKTGEAYLSLANCSMDDARRFINTLTDFCLEEGVITSDSLLEYTDDIHAYLYQCLVHRKCSICGKKGEIHHWDAIGMGNDRRTYDDRNNRKICLCRLHHTIAHQKGSSAFARDYHVMGIIYTGDEDGI